MNPRTYAARLTLALAAAAVLAVPWSSPAHAETLGGIDVVPTKGNAETLVSVVTERGCQEPAARVSAVLTGPGLPQDGQVIVAPSELLFSTTRPMELPLSNAFVVYADRNSTPLQGTYTIIVRCTDRIGVTVVDEFRTTMNWSTPSKKLANVAEATYVAKSTAGVVAAAAAKRATPPTGSPSATAPVRGDQPLANDERADGSNPGLDGDASASGAPQSGGNDGLRTVLVLGAGLLALLIAGVLALRGRRSGGASGDAA